MFSTIIIFLYVYFPLNRCTVVLENYHSTCLTEAGTFKWLQLIVLYVSLLCIKFLLVAMFRGRKRKIPNSNFVRDIYFRGYRSDSDDEGLPVRHVHNLPHPEPEYVPRIQEHERLEEQPEHEQEGQEDERLEDQGEDVQERQEEERLEDQREDQQERQEDPHEEEEGQEDDRLVERTDHHEQGHEDERLEEHPDYREEGQLQGEVDERYDGELLQPDQEFAPQDHDQVPIGHFFVHHR